MANSPQGDTHLPSWVSHPMLHSGIPQPKSGMLQQGYDDRELIEMSLSPDAASSCTAGRNAKL